MTISAPASTLADISVLNSLAVQSLTYLFDEKKRLFYRRVRWSEQRVLREETSRKHSLIAALGLQVLMGSEGALAFDTSAIRDAILEDISWVGGAEDLGLLTWFTAVCAPERLPELLDSFDFARVLETSIDGRQHRTRALAYFLAGIAHAKNRGRADSDLVDAAAGAYRLLLANQAASGLFRHVASPGPFRETASRWHGTFADQMYPIYALTTFARAFEIEEPLGPALYCANAVCALQGPMGQWWFLYDSRKGSVAARYPVLCAQQDGTAPLALLALEKASGQKFWKFVEKGLAWIAGANELANDLRNLERGFVWDSIGTRTRLASCWKSALNFLGAVREPRQNGLAIRYEMRPDHFGWLLYALGRVGIPKQHEVGHAFAAGIA
jgi:hypothetical protein